MHHSYRNTCAEHSNIVLILCEYFNSPPVFSFLTTMLGWSVFFFLLLPTRLQRCQVWTQPGAGALPDSLGPSPGWWPASDILPGMVASLRHPSWAARGQHQLLAASAAAQPGTGCSAGITFCCSLLSLPKKRCCDLPGWQCRALKWLHVQNSVFSCWFCSSCLCR